MEEPLEEGRQSWRNKSGSKAHAGFWVFLGSEMVSAHPLVLPLDAAA